MKARPILMSSAMVRALLEGRKTQTRRILKPQPIMRTPLDEPRIVLEHPCNPPEHFGKWQAGHEDRISYRYFECPYGRPGDLLWVRETAWIYHAEGGRKLARYPADAPAGARPLPINNGPLTAPAPNKTTPSIHVPRWASRITLELIAVRIERLQNIDNGDCRAEGYPPAYHPKDHVENTHRGWYADLWESINGKGSWDANPFVWVLEFRVHKQNVDEFLKARPS